MSRYRKTSDRRPVLVLIDQAEFDGALMDADVIRAEAQAHVRRLRMAMQTRFWTDPEFRVLAKPILTEIEAFARKLDDEDGRAA